MNDAPPLRHPLNCICDCCCELRRAEADARRHMKEVRADELRAHRAAFFEATIRLPKKAQPGTLRAIAKRYGRAS